MRDALAAVGCDIGVESERIWIGSKDDLYLYWVYKIAEVLHSKVKVKITAMIEEEILADPRGEVPEKSSKPLHERSARTGRKPNWLKALEKEYADNPEGLRVAIEDWTQLEDARKKLRQEKRKLNEIKRKLKKQAKELKEKSLSMAAAISKE